MIHQRVFYFISELIFVLNRHKDTSLSTTEFIISNLETIYVKLSKHIYFCEIVYFRTFLKTKKCRFGQNLIYKDNFALKYQLNKDKFPCSVKMVKVTCITI